MVTLLNGFKWGASFSLCFELLQVPKGWTQWVDIVIFMTTNQYLIIKNLMLVGKYKSEMVSEQYYPKIFEQFSYMSKCFVHKTNQVEWPLSSCVNHDPITYFIGHLLSFELIYNNPQFKSFANSFIHSTNLYSVLDALYHRHKKSHKVLIFNKSNHHMVLSFQFI